MVLSLFNNKVKWFKNGTFWYSKMINRLIGEKTYDRMRLERRIFIARFYYIRQQMLYEIFVDAPEIANTIGIYPKIDSSHGFPLQQPYEMFRDFQENTINSDGWFAWFVVIFCGAFVVHEFYSYLLPYYWIRSSVKNGEYERHRMRDTLSTAVAEEIVGNQFSELIYTPHSFHAKRFQGSQGYLNPDDPRMVSTATFNRLHKLREHYKTRVGDENSMTIL